jgi:hypothetical protein
MMPAIESKQRCGIMTNQNHELSIEQLGIVSGGGIVDNVLPESEAATTEFLKKFAEQSQKFNAFIAAPTGPAPSAPQEG